MLIKGKNTKYISTTGWFYSVKNTRWCEWEGALEQAFMHRLDLDLTVASYREHPVAIQYVHKNGRPTHYTPDMLVHYVCVPGHADRSPLLCEIKPRRILEEQRPKFSHPFRVARAYAAERGWRFGVLHEGHIRTPFLKNAQLLVPHLKLEPNEELARHLIAALTSVGRASVVSLVELVEPDPAKRPTIYPELWRLIACHRICTDLEKKLTGHSTLWVP